MITFGFNQHFIGLLHSVFINILGDWECRGYEPMYKDL